MNEEKSGTNQFVDFDMGEKPPEPQWGPISQLVKKKYWGHSVTGLPVVVIDKQMKNRIKKNRRRDKIAKASKKRNRKN